jgi:hypothetical protein
MAELQDHIGQADIKNTMIYARITNPGGETRSRGGLSRGEHIGAEL